MAIFCLVLLILVLIAIMTFVTIERRRRSTNVPSTPPAKTYKLGMDPNYIPFPYEYYRIPPIPTCHLPEWSEAIAHNHLVDFGAYKIGINDNQIAIIDANGGKHRIQLSSRPRITYADPMVLYIETTEETIIISRGSPFITTNKTLKVITDSGLLKPKWYQSISGFVHLTILPYHSNLQFILNINTQVIIRKTTIEKGGKLAWHTTGPDPLLLFIPQNLSEVAQPTGIIFKLGNTDYRLERGNIWTYTDFNGYPISDVPSNYDKIVYDPRGGRLIDLDQPYETIPRLLKWVEEHKLTRNMGIINPILRYVYGIVPGDSYFSPHYGIDFYHRRMPKINLDGFSNVEIIKDLMSLIKSPD